MESRLGSVGITAKEVDNDETTPEAIPAETDDARSIDSPAADNHP